MLRRIRIFESAFLCRAGSGKDWMFVVFAVFLFGEEMRGVLEMVSILPEKSYICNRKGMSMKKLYIIAGCNGAGKTTASYTVLPEMLDCHEFVNADEIARGPSPFNLKSKSIDAGRLMLIRIKTLLNDGADFAFETTLATKYYVNLVRQAQEKGYYVTLVYFWLRSPEMAVERVRTRVEAGGHGVGEPEIRRRYAKGIKNLFDLYMPVCDYWIIFDSSNLQIDMVAKGAKDETKTIVNPLIYKTIKEYERG